MSNLPQTDRATVAVITGGHAYDVPAFHAVFRSLPDADCYIQHMEDFVCDGGKVRKDYDVVLFYNMPDGAPPEKAKGWEGAIRRAMEELGTMTQGIFLLHHAILTYRGWPFWSEIVGIEDRELESYHHGEQLHIEIADGDHPITQGMQPWDMIDETYVMNDPGGDSRVLLTVDHPNSMKAIGWVHTFRNSRVFCFESGHDNETYVDPSFREVVRRGIQWCAGKL
jgi:hypothetical protein